MKDHFLELLAFCIEYWQLRGITQDVLWKPFYARLADNFVRFAEQLFVLYGHRPDFGFYVAKILENLFFAYKNRPLYLKKRDEQFPVESGWYLSPNMIGAVAYVDRFAGTFKGIQERLSYLQELGISYLHLMPFYRSPEKENDGGYAVSSYRETDPKLGTIEDLQELSRVLLDNGIVLVADFIFNHTSDEHEWALKAKAGNQTFEQFYWTFANYEDVQQYQAHLRDIFPEVRKGSFTYCEALGKWVWTTFHSYQWDLRYENPAVFNAMAQEMLAIANSGISVLRLDAVAFTWKRKGTSCENLPEAHTLIQAFRTAAKIVAPSLLFKSEAIVHPAEIAKYIDREECQLSYNPLLMAELWEASATKEVRLLVHSFRKHFHIPEGCAWVNYIRCHDDIGWTFADEDAAELGINAYDHRKFLNEFYMGLFLGSFSRGVSFQYNPHTGDRRICGTAASLAGIELALEQGSGYDIECAVRRLLMLYGIIYAVSGIPLLYLGDEIAALNDYSYEQDPHHCSDSRWVHRPRWSDEAYKNRHTVTSLAGKVFTALCTYARIRKTHDIFGAGELEVLDSGHPSVLVLRKQHKNAILLVVANFSEHSVTMPAWWFHNHTGGSAGKDLLSGKLLADDEELRLESCGIVWLGYGV